MTKKCTRCSKIKPLDKFYNSKNTKDKKSYYCKSCRNTEDKKIRYNKCACGNTKRDVANNCRTCAGKLRTKHLNNKWKGGKWVTANGYIYIHDPHHPKATKHGYVMEHRLVMEEHLGRFLLPEENIHHKNGVRDDNNIHNLELWCKHQPIGSRIKDLILFSKDILSRYGTDESKY